MLTSVGDPILYPIASATDVTRTWGLALAGSVELNLETYSEDSSCSKIVYAEIGTGNCPESPTCTIKNDDNGEFLDAAGESCIEDRDTYLQTAFEGASYLTIETYSSNCVGDLYDTRSYLADGKYHPYKFGHFKIAEATTKRPRCSYPIQVATPVNGTKIGLL
ncbi:unnamed protein product [Phytophthora lilii]|uniref:Unnamed protein product n=1 Tax=Phytophthora lilii TaxID=2077276 RepID=A0A9W6XLK7_9STRA|nr:unnamed protein product [Phytophthora lilii]